MILKIVFFILLSPLAFTQTANIKDIPIDSDTTISVSKNKNSLAEYAISEGSAEISGEPAILLTEARKNWKKACDEWKQETKDLNKDNQILAISCNKSQCEKNSITETICSSNGTYKIKTKVR
jgi:hypothetical protein